MKDQMAAAVKHPADTKPKPPHPLVRRTWEILRDSGEWPSRECAERWFHESRLPTDRYAVQERVPGLQVYDSHVCLTPAAALRVPEIRRFLRNVPELLQRIARLYVEEFDRASFYSFDGAADERWVPHEFLVEVAGSAEGAIQFTRVLAALNVDPFRHPHQDAGGRPAFRLDLGTLKFGSASTLDEWLALLERRRFTDHQLRELLDRIAKYCEERGDWPPATRFAIENRELGFVPDLVSASDWSAIDTNFRTQRSGKLELRLGALPRLSSRPRIEQVLDSVYPVLFERWEAGEQILRVERLAEVLGQPVLRVGFALRFLQYETGLQINVHGSDPSLWEIRLGPHLRKIEDWKRSTAKFLAQRAETERKKQESAAAGHEARMAMHRLQADAAERALQERAGRVAREKLRKEYKRLLSGRGMTPQRRGQRFNGFLAELLTSYGLQSEPNMNTEHGEIDIGVRFGPRRMVCQAKWKKNAINWTPLFELSGRVGERLGATGFMVSMSGYTRAALKKADSLVPRILLLNKEHVDALVAEKMTAEQLFDSALDLAELRAVYAPSIVQLREVLARRGH